MMTKQRLIQLIHIARGDLQMDEDTYRQMLQGLTGTASTKGMDLPQLTKVLDSMKKKGFRVKPAGNAKTGIALDDHPQSRKIRALWLDMAAAGVIRDSSELSLARWVKRETGVDGLRWLNSEQASSVIEKLKKWHYRTTGKRT